MTNTIFAILLLVSHASAHGFVSQISINGEIYKGNVPSLSADPSMKSIKSIIRQISDPSPVKGATNPGVNCGNGSQLAATVQPGDTLSFFRLSADLSSPWPHNVGPMMTYLAKCPDKDCTTFDSSTAQWLKLKEEGHILGNAKGDWVQNLLYLKKTVPANATLPSNLAPGAYLIRHEIIALQVGGKVYDPSNVHSGTEFYPSCAQIVVGGTETGAPAANELVYLPGVYPSPRFVSGSSSGDPSIPVASSSPSVTSSTDPRTSAAHSSVSVITSMTTPATSAAKSSSTGSCRKNLKRRNSTSLSNRGGPNLDVLGPDAAYGYMRK
ncbi:glycosyl hydrolase family 61-domain-containing protein [Mycena latifolia]|nr:glycosyl hydrolase family 61-domain-containing protein [Mycena latifolia]